MKHMKRFLSLAVIALICAVSLPAGAEEGEGSFVGSFQIGFREVDVNGRVEKYKEDLNLADGPRLFNLYFDYVPGDELRKFADHVELDINNFGGDPFETLRLSVQKFGRYDFKYDRRKSTYFYDDIILPVEIAGDPALARAGDFHTFDFDRVRDSASLDIRINQAAKFNFGFDRFTKKGHSTTTLDISRDEFELDKPVDESLNDYIASFEYAFDKVTVVLEERYRDYENVVEIFLPGQSLGEDPLDATILDFYFLDQPYDFTSSNTTARVIAQPTNNWLVRFAGSVESLDMDFHAAEHAKGTAFNGVPFLTDFGGNGDVDRDLELFDIDVTYMINDRWAILFGGRSNTLDQSGRMVFADEPGTGSWDIDTESYELGFQVAISTELTVSGGVREETRDVDFGWSFEGEDDVHQEKTDQTGYWLTVGWHPSKHFSLTGEFEDSTYDHPFTLASPDDRQRYRVMGRYKRDNGFWASASYLLTEYDNDHGYKATFDQGDLRLGYNKSGLNASLGYNMVEIERKVDQTVVTLPGFGGGQELFFPIFYDADSDFLDGRVRWEAGDRITVGADFRLYENSGSFALERNDYRGWLEFGLGEAYLIHLGYRTVDYDEAAFDFDDYDADIAEVSIGYRWK